MSLSDENIYGISTQDALVVLIFDLLRDKSKRVTKEESELFMKAHDQLGIRYYELLDEIRS